MFDKGHVLTLGSNEYQLLETLSTQGGHAQVWRAQLLGQAGEFVVKYPYLKRISSLAGSKHVDDFIQRAKTEIALLQKFTPNAATNHICPLHDGGIVTTRYGDLPVLVLPYLSGKFPEAIVDEKVTYDTSTALRWLHQTTMALKYLHDPQQNCLIHRDLKPANILLDANGDIRIIDLGITKPERQANGETTSSMLSDKWAAPEQIIPVDMSEEGEWLYRLHTSMDIYALGLLAYYLFSKGKVIAYQAHVEGKHTSRRNSYWNSKPRLPWEDALVALAELETKGIKDGKDERQFLEGVKALLAAEYAYTPPTGTLIGTAFPMLPDAAWVAGYLWEQVSQWLNPLPEKRPDAQQVLDCLEQVEAALHPKLKALSLSAAPEPIILGEQPVFIVELEGSNLPPIGSWLEVDWDDSEEISPVPQVQWQAEDPQQPNGLVNGKLRLQLQLPAMQKTGDFTLEVSARVWQQDMLSANHAFKVVQTPQQLWDRGDKQAAVRLDPRPEWLAYLLRQATTLDQRIELRNFLKELQKYYSEDEQKQQHLQEAFNSVESGMIYDPTIFRWKKWICRLFMLVFGFIIVFFSWEIYIKNSHQISGLEQQASKYFELSNQTLNGLKIIKDTSDIDVQRTYYRDLKELVKAGKLHPDVQPEAEQLLESYFNDADMDYKSDTANGTKLALARSTVLAEQEKRIEAMVMIGMIYRSGKDGVVEKNQKLGCDWLKKAGDTGYDSIKVDGYNLTEEDYEKLCPDQ